MKLRIFDPHKNATPKSVFITRLSAIGDCVLTLPLAVKVKELWPECKVTWMVDCAAAQLLDGHPAIDEVLQIEKHWLRRPSKWSELRRQLRLRAFDLVLDPQGLNKSAILGRLSGATHRVGFDYSQSREAAPWLSSCRIHRTARHMVDTYLQLLSPWCDLQPGEGQFLMPNYLLAAERAESILQEFGLQSKTSKWVAINAGAGWPSKLWPPERFGRIAQEIFQRYGLRSLVLWGSEQEHTLADLIAEHSAGSAQAAPQTNLCELVELIRRTELLISADTAALQIASAVNTNCVGLFGPTWADEVGPYRNKHISIQSTILPDPRRGMRRSSSASMNAIEISEVLRACNQILTSRPQSARAA